MKKFKVIESSRFLGMDVVKGGQSCPRISDYSSCTPVQNYTYDYICATRHVTCTNSSYSICSGSDTRSTCQNTYAGPQNPFLNIAF